MRDLRYALRTVRKNPAFALTAILTLALAIGANTAIFTVVNAVLLKPLEYQEPDRLVRISGGATVAKFETIAQAQSFTGAGAFTVFTDSATLSAADGPQSLKGARVSTNFLSILGVAPLRGRSFLPGEEALGSGVAMISAELWQRNFGGDAAVVGGTVRLDAGACTIVGVLPAGFQFPFPDVDVWRPFQPGTLTLESRLNSPILSVFGRLKPEISLSQASAEMTLINSQYGIAHPGMLDARRDRQEHPTLLKDQMVKNIRSMLWMLFGAVTLVVLIACANVASLLLARAASRSREFAVRAALGASRGRLMRQLLTESLLLAGAGGGLGVLVALWGLRGIAHLPGLDLPRQGDIHMDAMVLGFAVLLSIATSLVFGLAPWLRASRPDLVSMMKGSGEAPVTEWSKHLALCLSPRGLLVIGQVALSIMLLIGAALLVQSLARLRHVDPGFQSAHLLTMQISLPQSRYDTREKNSAFYADLVQRVEAIPGVRSAGVTMTLPMTGFAATPVYAAGRPLVKLNERPVAILQSITPGYFRTLGIPLRRGRDFTGHDSATSPLVAVISEALARRFWPAYPQGEDPVGRFVMVGAGPKPVEIVGIVADIRQAGLADDERPGIYRPRTQLPPYPAMFAVRTDGDPLQFVNAIRGQVMAIDRDQAITAVKTMEEVVDSSEGQRRSVMILLGLFAGIGLVLAVVGIYGVIAYVVSQRTRELGIRQALGARRSDILQLVLRQGLALTLLGAAAGLAGAVALTRVLQGLVFGISTTDPLTFAGVAVLLILVALAASFIPARRATKIDPAAALRVG